MLNSDDIEVATLAANILRKEKGKSYVANLIRKYDKYEFKKKQGLVKKNNWSNILSAWNKLSLLNTPLLNMAELIINTSYTDEKEGEFTFNIPYKT